jgi:hypothetical protein
MVAALRPDKNHVDLVRAWAGDVEGRSRGRADRDLLRCDGRH